MKMLRPLICLSLLLLLAPAVHAGTPERTPPRLDKYRTESFKRYRTEQRPTDGYEMKLPYQFGSWKLKDPVFQDRDDKRNDMALLGAKPTLLFVLGDTLNSDLASQNSRLTEPEQQRQDKLLALFKELDAHAKANHSKYDVFVLFRTLSDYDREAIRKVFKNAKPEYLNLAETSYAKSKHDDSFDNYWSNLIQKPVPEMVTETDAPYPPGSWVWMRTPGTAEAWGVWGFESELKRLEEFAKAADAPKAFALTDADQLEIAELMAHWQLGEAEKKLARLEKKAEGDAGNFKLLHELEKYLEDAYREHIAGAYKKDGYLVEYADAMTTLAEEFYGKRSDRGGEIADEMKEYRKSDEYKHCWKAKATFEKLRDGIDKQIGGNVHGDAYAKRYIAILKKNKSRIDKFNEEFGDTPYAETTRRWAKDLQNG